MKSWKGAPLTQLMRGATAQPHLDMCLKMDEVPLLAVPARCSASRRARSELHSPSRTTSPPSPSPAGARMGARERGHTQHRPPGRWLLSALEDGGGISGHGPQPKLMTIQTNR